MEALQGHTLSAQQTCHTHRLTADVKRPAALHTMHFDHYTILIHCPAAVMTLQVLPEECDMHLPAPAHSVRQQLKIANVMCLSHTASALFLLSWPCTHTQHAQRVACTAAERTLTACRMAACPLAACTLAKRLPGFQGKQARLCSKVQNAVSAKLRIQSDD